MDADMDAISVQNLTKKYGSKIALSSVSFSVGHGTFFGCFGRNGAGKSTLLRVLTGQIQQTAGEAKVLGLDCRTQGLEIKREIGIVPEVESPPSYLTAAEFLEFAGKVRKVDDLDRKVAHWLDFFELNEAHGTLCRDLSKGMRQKVMLAAAFIHEPKLIFLDEPFINLDPIYQRKLREYLTELRDEGRTIFLSSHMLEIAQRLCEEVVILDKGKVLARENMGAMTQRGEDLEGLFMRLVGGNHAGSP